MLAILIDFLVRTGVCLASLPGNGRNGGAIAQAMVDGWDAASATGCDILAAREG
jgi:hypothetical protein